MRIICISDTHGMHREVDIPEGDVLVHAGDITGRGELDILEDFNEWLGELPHKHKVVIAGNHDFCFEDKSRHRNAAPRILTNCTYLQDSGVTIDGVKFWGTPWQPYFCNWAFNIARAIDRANKWALIPEDTNVLLVHGPPYMCGDLTDDGQRPGCERLKMRIEELNMELVVCGHIHEDYGLFPLAGTDVLNASVCTFEYEPIQSPFVYDLGVGLVIDET